MADEQWHLDKRVPVAIIVALVLQTCGAVWWAATMQERVANSEQSIARLQATTAVNRDAATVQAVQLGRIEEQITGLRSDIGRLLTAIERTRQ